MVDRITAEEEEEQNVEGRSYGQTENEIENYELEEQNQDPYKIQREPDLTREQEEYFRPIRQDWIDIL
ncbi:MAG: hypothetical protein WAM14_12320 [Candidatus Nitrosopolaris sp.]